jgi:hypothetical protein
VCPNVRKDAGIVGASDWANRYIICAGGDRAGSSTSGDITGHHITIADPTRRTWQREVRELGAYRRVDDLGPVGEQQQPVEQDQAPRRDA